MRTSHIKYNPILLSIYNFMLSYRCRNVKGYFFVATTGRSGSGSLSEAFKAVRGAVTFHEPYPVMYCDYKPGADRERYFNDLFWKVKRINVKRAAAGHTYYLETNHQFIKNFISQALICFKDKIKIIHLVRNPVLVGSSLYSIGSIPGITRQGKLYLADPDDEMNLIKISDLLNYDSEFENSIYKCFWYWYEIETRIKKFKKKYANIPWIRIKTDDLNDTEELCKFFRELSIEVDLEKIEAIVGIRKNTKFQEKTQKIPIDECKSMHENLLKKMEERYGPKFWC